jgi:drug/metabolite transporter, DME family
VSPGIARLQVLAAAVLFSTGGAAIKADAFTGLQVSALRSGIAAIVLILLLRGRLVLSLPMLATGVVYAATLTLFVLSTKLTTAANAIFLQATAPLYLLVLGPLLLHERFRTRDIVFLVGVAVGLVLCVLGRPLSRRRLHTLRPATCSRSCAASPGRSPSSDCAISNAGTDSRGWA